MTDPHLQLVTDAFEIADGAARADIETSCKPAGAPPALWWDTSDVESTDKEFVELALRYLEARGQVIRKPGAPHLVSFVEGA